jgi:16S rRNA (cytidine1402-2'-O)-methyltransferase
LTGAGQAALPAAPGPAEDPQAEVAQVAAGGDSDLGDVQLWLVPTPLGNLGDITLRATEVLRACDAVACEDTRRSGQLLAHLGISRPLVRLDAHTMNRAPGVLAQYPRLAYVSDAGMPGISDPGAELLRLVVAGGGHAEVLPGPSALLPALVLSGLDTARFTFEGFLPRSGRDRKDRLAAVAARSETTVLYESPHRLEATLRELALGCGNERRGSVTRELTKKFEETRRGTLATLADWASAGVRGEIVVCVAGLSRQEVLAAEQAAAPDPDVLARELAAAGRSVREIRDLLQAQGLRKNDAYAAALRASAPADAAP